MQFPLNKYTYFIITIFLYLIIFNDLVLCKGGGGKRSRDGGDSGGTTKSTFSSTPSFGSRGGRSSSTWVFFYYGPGGQRYCGNICIAVAVIIPIVLLLIIGCGIWRCYRIRKRYRDEEKLEEMKVDEHHGNSVYNNITPEVGNSNNNYGYPYPTTTTTAPNNYGYPHPPLSTTTTTAPNNYEYPYPPLSTTTTAPNFPPPTYSPPRDNYFNNNLDGNYTNYAPGDSKLSPPENIYPSQMKSNSRRESFDSMDEVMKNKKKKY